MRHWKGLLFSILALYLGMQWQMGRLHFSRNPSKLSGNTCEGKTFCVVIYLAPWCPHCKEAMPYTQEILARSQRGDTGVKVVVGMGNPEQNKAMASQIAQNVQIDDDQGLRKKLGVQSVPAYFVLDRDGSTVLGGIEGLTWVMEKFRK